MLASDFDFDLPAALIAQAPARPRDAARLLVPHLSPPDRGVRDLPGLLRPGDLLVVNDTRVIPAQLAATRLGATVARVGLTLDAPQAGGTWRALARNARRLRAGDRLAIDGTAMTAEVIEVREGGAILLGFDREGPAFDAALAEAGRLALPPYIERPDGPNAADAADYQTAFARHDGAVAAPTAGLHFTQELIGAVRERDVRFASVTLHVGAGTFLPMRGDDVAAHAIHSERGVIGVETVRAVAQTRREGGRVVAVGTTSLRLLETAADGQGGIRAFSGETSLFVLPGFRFGVVDGLLTNFHLPRSTLFMLVCAFAGVEPMKRAYAHAIAAGYRFYSYGDACLLERR